MTSLLDIGPLTETVNIGGKPVAVRGVTPEGFFYLLAKFPLLQQLFSGGAKEVSMETLQTVAPACVSHALAVATTDRTEFASTAEWTFSIEAAAKVAVNLPAHYQMELFQAALRLTFPDGIGPFMKAMEHLANSITKVSGGGQINAGSEQGTTSSKRSRSGFSMDSRGMRLGPARPSANSVH